MNVFPATLREFLRHTGAGSFMRSSAVRYYSAVLWYLIEMCRELIGGNAKSVRQFLIRLSPRRWISCVNERKLFAPIQPFSYFIRSKSCCFHCHLHYSTVYQNHLCFLWSLWQKDGYPATVPELDHLLESCMCSWRVRRACFSRQLYRIQPTLLSGLV